MKTTYRPPTPVKSPARSEKRRESWNVYRKPIPFYQGQRTSLKKSATTKAWSYKIIFTVLKKLGEVIIVTIRHDKEDPDNVLDDL